MLQQWRPAARWTVAVAETRFLPLRSQAPQSMRLVAITDGEAHVRLYSLDTSGQVAALDFEDEITIKAQGIVDPIAFTPAFMDLISIRSLSLAW